jgi:hypothetical protein
MVIIVFKSRQIVNIKGYLYRDLAYNDKIKYLLQRQYGGNELPPIIGHLGGEELIVKSSTKCRFYYF